MSAICLPILRRDNEYIKGLIFTIFLKFTTTFVPNPSNTVIFLGTPFRENVLR